MNGDVRFDFLDIIDSLNSAEELCAPIPGEFAARVTIEIRTVIHENAAKKPKLKFGEVLWKGQQLGNIETVVDDYGHGITKVVLLELFTVLSKELWVNKTSIESPTGLEQNLSLDLTDPYFIKIGLEASTPFSQWPPLELESRLEHGGQMQRWLQDGTFAKNDIRLCGKAVLSVSESACYGFEMALKLGGFRIKTRYALNVAVHYSPLPQVDHDDILPLSRSFQRLSTGSALVVPACEERLFESVFKTELVAGKALEDDDAAVLEPVWKKVRHDKRIEDSKGIGEDTKKYMKKWNDFVYPLQMAANFYVSSALLVFAKENIGWFAEDRSMIKQFSLHVTSLRIRGVIDIECFMECLKLLRPAMGD